MSVYHLLNAIKKIIHSQSTAQFTMNSLFSNIFLLIFCNKQRVNHQYYSQTSAGSHPTSWPCWSLRMCSLTFILQLYKSCTMTVGATHPKWPTFLRRTQQLTCLMMCAVQCWISTLDAMIFQVQILMKLIHSLPCSAPHQYIVSGGGHSGVHTVSIRTPPRTIVSAHIAGTPCKEDLVCEASSSIKYLYSPQQWL